MTVTEIFQDLKASLLKQYDDREASAVAEMVLEKLIYTNRLQRAVDPKREIAPYLFAKVQEAKSKLLTGCPVQYVLQETWFCGLPFKVGPEVLIPRPETEELVEWVVDRWKKKGARASITILDICTGSGCIAVSLKLRMPGSIVQAIDISQEALRFAVQNSMIHAGDIDFRCMDLLDEPSWKDFKQYDILVSNPPYIKLSEKSEMEFRVKDFEPAIALFVPDQDPLIFYEAIAKFSNGRLTEGGEIFLEINQSLGEETAKVFQSKGFQTELRHDFYGNMRMLRVWH